MKKCIGCVGEKVHRVCGWDTGPVATMKSCIWCVGEKIPQKALGYVQKTITQALSHSLTTELSQVITSELTTAMSDMVSGLLSDSLASTIPGKTFFFYKNFVFLALQK